MQVEKRKSHTVRMVRPGWLESDDTRVVLFDVDRGLDSLHRAYFDEVGVSDACFLYLAGLRAAVEWAPRIRHTPAVGLLAASIEILTDQGYGAFQIAEAASPIGRATVIAEHTVESWTYLRRQARSQRPVCSYVSGALAGTWCVAVEPNNGAAANLVCWETQCAAAGAAQCRFELGSADRLRGLGFADPFQSPAVRWELHDLNRKLQYSHENLSKLERSLAEREGAYLHLLDNMNDRLLVLSRDKKLVFCNKRFVESTGLPLDALLGTSPVRLIVPEDRARVEQIHDDLLAGRRPSETYTYRVIRPNGLAYFESSAKAVRAPDGNIVLEIIARDVSEREKARLQLEQTHANLVRQQAVVEYDLKMAKRVHESLLPRPIAHDALDIDVKYVPAGRVGGDYCHIAFPTPDHCVVTLCDVSGHGTAAALLAARVSSQVVEACRSVCEPLAITAALNRFLLDHFSDTGLFVTFFALVIDLRSFAVSYCGAGHPGPLLLRKSGAVETLASNNLPVGIIEGFLRPPAVGIAALQPGDRLLLYTDGVTETNNAQNQALGADGLQRLFIATAGLPLFTVGDLLLQQIAEFRSTEMHDDMTLLIVEMKAPIG